MLYYWISLSLALFLTRARFRFAHLLVRQPTIRPKHIHKLKVNFSIVRNSTRCSFQLKLIEMRHTRVDCLGKCCNLPFRIWIWILDYNTWLMISNKKNRNFFPLSLFLARSFVRFQNCTKTDWVSVSFGWPCFWHINNMRLILCHWHNNSIQFISNRTNPM